jgi:DNA invertase Pin-like site-specific DNA recombinase
VREYAAVAKKAIGYIRVSRVGGRSGDSFISPELQQESIERVCALNGLTLIDTYTELDASGGDASRKLWNRAIDRVVSGEAQAVVTWNLSRFSRSVKDALGAMERIEAAGGKVYSEEGNLDKLSRTIRLAIAEDERDRQKAGFRVAQANAISRGIAIAAQTPYGYVRNPQTRRYEIDPIMALLVVEVFERRVRGNSWASIAKWFAAQGGSGKTNGTAIRGMIGNPAYLGHARNGDMVNRNAHPPIVSQTLFDAANAVKGTKSRQGTGLSDSMLLRGIATCAECGHRLQITSSKFRNAAGEIEREPGYTCRNIHCAARAYCRASELDGLVTRALFLMFDAQRMTVAQDDGSDLAEAERTVEVAESDRRLFIKNRELRRILSVEEYNAELEALTEAVEAARMTLEMATPSAVVTTVDALWDSWTNETRREWLFQVIASLTVASARRKKVPLHTRIDMHLEQPAVKFNPDKPFGISDLMRQAAESLAKK